MNAHMSTRCRPRQGTGNVLHVVALATSRGIVIHKETSGRKDQATSSRETTKGCLYGGTWDNWGVRMEMLLDSGSSVSLVQEGSILQSASITKIRPTPCLELVTTSGEKLKLVDHISALVQVGEVPTNHQFVAVNR